MRTDLANDMPSVFGRNVKLCHHSSVWSVLPATEHAVKALMVMNGSEDKFKIALTLLKQFAHYLARQLKLLFKEAVINDPDYNALINDISEACEVCRNHN